jgi:hypothetical protein
MTSELLLEPRIRQLDFLLGDVHCVSSGETPVEMTMHTVPMLNGHYLMSEGRGPGPQAVGRIFGWDPTTEEFTEYFFSDMGGHGFATSPGWQDGQLVMTGSFRFAGIGERRGRDYFRRVGADDFTIESQAGTDAGWKTVQTFSCHRTKTLG